MTNILNVACLRLLLRFCVKVNGSITKLARTLANNNNNNNNNQQNLLFNLREKCTLRGYDGTEKVNIPRGELHSQSISFSIGLEKPSSVCEPCHTLSHPFKYTQTRTPACTPIRRQPPPIQMCLHTGVG